jgi:hypothetical protein
MDNTTQRIKQYITDYQNYDGARVIALSNNVDGKTIKDLVGDFYFKLYNTDPVKLFNLKVKRGYWRDNPAEYVTIRWYTRLLSWFSRLF